MQSHSALCATQHYTEYSIYFLSRCPALIPDAILSYYPTLLYLKSLKRSVNQKTWIHGSIMAQRPIVEVPLSNTLDPYQLHYC